MANWQSDLAAQIAAHTAGDRFPIDPKALQNGDTGHGAGVWANLRQHSNPNNACPEANPKVIARGLNDHEQPYYVIKNPDAKTYLRLSEDEYRLYRQMDGKTSVQDLIVEHYMATGAFAHKKILRLVSQLQRNSMLTELPVRTWVQVRGQVQKRSWSNLLSTPARLLLTQKLSIRGVDRISGWIYRTIGRPFFSKPAQFLYILISLAGLYAFFRIVQSGTVNFVQSHFASELGLWWLATLLPLFIHELGHALTVKHYGREVPRGGFMLFFGLPAVFVETTDIWLEPRRARLAVTWNGPYTGLILGGAASLFMLANPGSPASPFLLKMSAVAYTTVFFNANPLLRYDGYYLLSDALDIPSLRQRSTAFVRKDLAGRIAKWKPLTREEKIYTVYGLLSFAWMGYALYLASYFWQSRIRIGLEALFGSGYPIFARILGGLGALGVLSLLVLLGVAVMRALGAALQRFAHSGELARHDRLAVILGAAGLVGGMLLVMYLPQYAAWVVAAVIGTAALLLLRFGRIYAGSLHYFANLALAIGLVLAAAGLMLPALGFLIWGAGSALAIAGILLDGRLRSFRRAWLTPILAALAGGAILWLVGIPFSSPDFWIGAVMAAAGANALMALRGSARSPALILLFAGGYSLMLIGMSAIGDFILPAVMLLAAGAFHIVLAQLPYLTVQEVQGVSATNQVIENSMAALVRRMVVRVYFENGRLGIRELGERFNRAMRKNNLDLAINGSRFEDPRLGQRSAVELSNVYALVLDELVGILSDILGPGLSEAAFAHALDLIPWQNREVIAEVVLSRMTQKIAYAREIADSKAALRDLLRHVPLFGNLDADSLDEIGLRLEESHAGAGENVIVQGEAGSKFYIIGNGEVSVLKSKDGGEPRRVARLGRGQYFGEEALVTDRPRNATIRAEIPTRLFSLNRSDFDALVRQYVDLDQNLNRTAKHSWLLRGMPIFDALDGKEIDYLSLQMAIEHFPAGQVVFHEGQAGDKFYVIESGQVEVTKMANGHPVRLSSRSAGEYFGEIALLQNRPRTATVTAKTETVLLSLPAPTFQELVAGYGKVADAVERTGSRRTKFVQAAGQVN